MTDASTEMFRRINASAHDIPMPDASAQCIVTSPPYWGLRKYAGKQGVNWPEVAYRMNEWTPEMIVPGMTCELGLEPDPVSYVGHLILCLREWRRVLRDDGTCWVNLGDSYNGSGGAGGDYSAGGLRAGQPKYGGRNNKSMKPKDLCGIPWLFALAARADGWYLRSDIIWDKPNSMPESVTDRPSKAHEYLFLLSKNRKYFYDADAVRVTSAYPFDNRGKRKDSRRDEPLANSMSGSTGAYRSLRTVWRITTTPTSYAHFATFPERLVEPCINAGTSARGCCPECGAPWERVVERIGAIKDKDFGNRYQATALQGGSPTTTLNGTPATSITTGWKPTCECWEYVDPDPETDNDDTIIQEPVPCTVLDPFNGSGTTGAVALRLGRAYVGVDISQEYLDGVTQERMNKAQMGMGL